MSRLSQNLLALNAAKHAIRAAINTKGGSLKAGDPLSDYPAAIENFSEDYLLRRCRVIFIDWDGTVLRDIYVERGASVTPPDVPAHEGITFSHWTRSAGTLAAVPHDMVVGACYNGKPGWNHFGTLRVEAGETVQFTQNCKVVADTHCTIDWGDGTEEVFATDYRAQSLTHTYAEAGDYDFKCYLQEGDGGCVPYVSYSASDAVKKNLIKFFNCRTDRGSFDNPYDRGSFGSPYFEAYGIAVGWNYLPNSINGAAFVDSLEVTGESRRISILPPAGKILFAAAEGQLYSANAKVFYWPIYDIPRDTSVSETGTASGVIDRVVFCEGYNETVQPVMSANGDSRPLRCDISTIPEPQIRNRYQLKWAMFIAHDDRLIQVDPSLSIIELSGAALNILEVAELMDSYLGSDVQTVKLNFCGNDAGIVEQVAEILTPKGYTVTA